MISAILSILGSSAVGTIIGGIFAFLNKKQDAQMELYKLQHELNLRDKDLELMRLEQEGRLAVAIEGTEGERFEAIGRSHEADKLDGEVVKAAGSWGKWLVASDVIRRLVRPVATVVLLGGALYVNFLLLGNVADGWHLLTSDQKGELLAQCLGWIFGQSSAVIAYWFVSRGKIDK
jgi:hypothetical protein